MSTPLPDTLQKQLAQFERQLRRSQTITAICGSIATLGASALAVFASDRLWDTPAAIRVVLMLAAWGLAVGIAATWVRAWILQRRNTRQLASLVQQRYRQLGDRLLGAVELAEQTGEADGISPRLRTAAINQVATAAADFDFGEAVDRRLQRRSLVGITAVLLLVLLAAGLAPQAFGNALSRWAAPWGGPDRYTFASLAAMPVERVVAHGEPFQIDVSLSADSRWKPKVVTIGVGDQDPIVADLHSYAATVTIPGQNADATLVVRAGDTSRSMRIRPVHRPILTEVVATVVYPAYLNRPSESLPLRNGALTVPQGSQIAWTGRANRPLRSLSSDLAGAPVAVVSGATFSIPAMPAAQWNDVLLTWVDEHGLAPTAPLKLSVQEKPDGPPTVAFPELAVTMAILVDETLEIPVVATDDFGLKTLDATWTVQDRDHRDQPGESFNRHLESGDPNTTRLESTFILAPAIMGIPPRSVIKLKARAYDYNPEHEAGESQIHTIFVLDHAEHARLLQQQFDRLRASIEDTAREEENLLNEKQDLMAKDDADMTSDETTAELEQQARRQERQAENLKELAKQGNELVKEAMRNESIPQEQLEQWNKMMQQIQDIAAEDMPKMSKDMQQASQSQSAKDRQQKVAEASETEREVIEKLREMQEKADESMQQMMARNFYMRLKELATREGQLSVAATTLLQQAPGMSRADLPPDLLAQAQAMEEQQHTLRQDALVIQRELASFFTRTRLEKYDAVAQAMQAADIDTGLTEIVSELRANRLANVAGKTKDWSEKFAAWAKLLEPPKQEGGGGGGGGGGGMSQEQQALMMALMRIVQEQEDLRTLTRLLGRHKDEVMDYPTSSRELSSREGGLGQALGQIYEMVGDPQTQEILSQAGLAINEAASLLNNLQTGEPTIAAQNEALELLLAGAESSAQQMGQASAAALAMMKAMMSKQQSQKMGMGAGQSPGAGSNMGGDSDVAGGDVTPGSGASANATDPNDRNSGKSIEHVPMEFREALEAYYREVDAP